MTQTTTILISLTQEEVSATMDRFLADLERDWPDEEQRYEVLLAKVTKMERMFLKDDVLPRVEQDEVAWLMANRARLTIKSSLAQFRAGTLRVQVLDREARARLMWWREN